MNYTIFAIPESPSTGFDHSKANYGVADFCKMFFPDSHTGEEIVGILGDLDLINTFTAEISFTKSIDHHFKCSSGRKVTLDDLRTLVRILHDHHKKVFYVSYFMADYRIHLKGGFSSRWITERHPELILRPNPLRATSYLVGRGIRSLPWSVLAARKRINARISYVDPLVPLREDLDYGIREGTLYVEFLVDRLLPFMKEFNFDGFGIYELGFYLPSECYRGGTRPSTKESNRAFYSYLHSSLEPAGLKIFSEDCFGFNFEDAMKRGTDYVSISDFLDYLSLQTYPYAKGRHREPIYGMTVEYFEKYIAEALQKLPSVSPSLQILVTMETKDEQEGWEAPVDILEREMRAWASISAKNRKVDGFVVNHANKKCIPENLGRAIAAWTREI